MKNLKITVPDGYEIDKENSTFEEIVFKKVEKTLPKKWEDIINLNNTVKGCTVSPYGNIVVNHITCDKDKFVFPTKEEAEACVALAQLCVLRDIYNGEPLDAWVDWTDSSIGKYCLNFQEDKLICNTFFMSRRPLVFKTEELRDEFLKNFKDLIIKAKPLL